MLLYLERAPRPPLRRFVRRIWVLESPPAAAPPPADRVLPDGCVEMVFHYADAFERRSAAEPAGATQHRHALVGQIVTALELRPLGRVGLLGVRFEPAGAGPLLRVPMASLTGRSAALEDVWSATARALADAVRSAATPGARMDAAERVLLAAAARAPSRRTLAEEAVEAIHRTAGAERLSDLCADLGTAGRRLERRFRDEVGLAPKTLARIVRFQASVRALRAATRPVLSHVAADHGYCDQAHLTRDFSEFAGAPPARWLRDEHPLAAAFLAEQG